MRTPTTGPHFFAPVEGDRALLGTDDAHHLARVLRSRVGDPVSLADGRGGVYQAEIAEIGERSVGLTVTRRWDVPAPRPRLAVVHALPKGRKLDDVVQRLSEVGVDRLVPVRSARSEARLDTAKARKAVQRWRSVALAAAKQSRRPRVLEIADVGDWAGAFDFATAGTVLWEEATAGLRDLLQGWPGVDELVLGIGPEGGLTEEEATSPGLPVTSLGETVLRTETAALVAASVVLFGLGRLGS